MEEEEGKEEARAKKRGFDRQRGEREETIKRKCDGITSRVCRGTPVDREIRTPDRSIPFGDTFCQRVDGRIPIEPIALIWYDKVHSHVLFYIVGNVGVEGRLRRRDETKGEMRKSLCRRIACLLKKVKAVLSIICQVLEVHCHPFQCQSGPRGSGGISIAKSTYI